MGGAPAARALALAPAPAAQKGRTPNSQTQQPNLKRLTSDNELIAGFGSWGAPLCTAGFAAKAGVRAQARLVI
jgi:hypothetical protein